MIYPFPSIQLYMSAVLYLASFAVGFLLGAGAMLVYFQYSIYRQAGNIQEQFQQIQEIQEQESDTPMNLDDSESDDE